MWELILSDLDRPFHAPGRALNVSTYALSSEFLIDCYYEKGALEPIVKIYSAQIFRLATTYDVLLCHLNRAGRHDLIERLWTSVTRLNRAEFLLSRDDESKRLALEAYGHGIDWMIKLGRDAAAGHLSVDRDALDAECFEALPPASNIQRIDEPVFWELIRCTRAEGSATVEQLATLGDLLRTFGAADIKRFGLLYAKSMQKLYHWNAWALGYAAMDGCSDGTFDGFRAWLILQGDPDLLELAVKDPAQAALHVPAEPDLPDGPCIWIIEDAYLRRKGERLELRTDAEKPRGKAWSEEKFERIYPELVEHYAAVTSK